VVIPGGTAVPDIRFTADYDYVDFNLGIRTDYTLVKNKLFLSPYVGAIYAMLDQRFTISAETPSDLVASPLWPYGKHEYRVTENLETHYFGATFGVDFIVRIIEGLTFTLGGTISPLYADTDMDIKFRGTMWTPTNPRVGTSTKVNDRDDTFTFRAMGKAQLAYQIGWFKAAVLGMVDYWDYVPVVEYPKYSSGDWGALTPATYPSDVPGLDDGNMTNWILMFTATILLPWP